MHIIRKENKMYKIVNFETGELIEKTEQPRWVRQQDRVDDPVLCYSYEEADGVVLSDGNTMLGIEGRDMQNYTPTVLVSVIPETELQISIMGGVLEDVVNQVASINEKVNTIYDAQTQGVVLQSELDAAYKEGVNSYAE